MAVVVNNPQPEQNNSGNNFLSGIVLVVILAILVIFFILYLLPRIGNLGLGGTQINIPDKFNINIQQSK